MIDIHANNFPDGVASHILHHRKPHQSNESSELKND
jgi:hypothetical protein